MTKRTKALVLFGGGLDSLLATGLVERQGVEPVRIHFNTGFVAREREAFVRGTCESIDVYDEYLSTVVMEPKYGYGGAMNPCLDCRIFMLRQAAAIGRERGIDLLVTGEVLGQRAIDQSRRALTEAENEAKVGGRVLRPLSAGLLPLTDAEREGRIDCEPRLRIAGSRRRDQLDLARQLGIAERPTPTGRCCRLADPVFARRLRDLLNHEDGHPTRESVETLSRGRHFRLSWKLKLIVARDEPEGRWLEERSARGWLCRVVDATGAVALLEGAPREDQLERVGSFVARYTRTTGEGPVDVEIRRGGAKHRVRCVQATDHELARARI